ncbi:uncharacterized protein TRIVIDRAFT_152163 [Trichoderma virens Gv29-8]|uniref:Zn(2)-C6 fungal-type domain-containing protein n=1 Tax=Hypocrea virens (strain Gv29-8 / FGSC 10586) TaxID=413071 RepID=G9MVF6_HYPVG|nr:uncharacterized protein TRIVIDRAFT_152163 [Trichoderma virens Gv29-8]EHK21582.1 hypothetical protein TRIVIDRAFT_152163 [Trichoderma virens Gv29-8]
MRSSHRKSRNGCRECKQRHKKCDESSPICRNCSITNRSCSYRHTRPSYRPFGTKSAAKPLPPSLSAVSSLTQCVTQEWRAQSYSLGHLELLHHFESRGIEETSMLPVPKSTRRLMMQCGLTNPYLMDQILALSAAHMSTIHQGQQQVFRNKATELQTRALTLFNRSELGISKQNSCSWFLYASLLGLQVMFETLQSRNFDSFLDQLATYFPVHRGVHAVVRKSWPTIKDIVEEIVGQKDLAEARGLGKRRPQECDDIISLVNECDLEESDKAVCLEAIELLQWTFELHRINPRTQFQVSFTIAWSILVPARFGEMLRQRIPEALTILSFYAVLLHRLHQFWVFGDSGRFLIQSISTYLGAPWAQWLIWPKEQLNAGWSTSRIYPTTFTRTNDCNRVG